MFSITQSGFTLQNSAIFWKMEASRCLSQRRTMMFGLMQLLDRMLRGLGFVLLRAAEVRHQSNVYEQAVLPAHLQRYLSHGLYEGLGFDVAYCSADLGYDHVRGGLPADAVHEFLYLVGYVRNNLHGGAEVLPAALLVKDVPVDLSGREVGVLVKVLVYEALVVPEVQIRLRAVLRYEHLAVLVGAHGPWVHVYVRIQLLRSHLKTARLKQPSQRGRRYSFAEARYDAACHKNVFSHSPLPASRMLIT